MYLPTLDDHSVTQRVQLRTKSSNIVERIVWRCWTEPWSKKRVDADTPAGGNSEVRISSVLVPSLIVV